MKKFTKLIALMLAGILLLASCGNEMPNAGDITEPTEPEATTTTAESTAAPALEDESVDNGGSPLEELYNRILESKPVWERENMIDITLIDLDFCGTPELLVVQRTYQPTLTIFKFDENNVLYEFYEIENLYFNEEMTTEMLSIVPYTDENGNKTWLIAYLEGRPYEGEYKTYSLSAFDFTGEISETIMFRSVIYHNYIEYIADTETYTNPLHGYGGYPFAKTEYYIDGEEFHAPEEETIAFFADIDRMVEEGYSDSLDNEVGLFPWVCISYYPNPTQDLWEGLKVDFLNEQLAVEPGYILFPNTYKTNEYDWGVWRSVSYQGAFSEESKVEDPILAVVNAYYSNSDFLRTLDLTYDNGGAACKPVLYLYPEEETNVSVKVYLAADGFFICTYPDYGEGWNVAASPNGTLINYADGHEYSYLYWSSHGLANWDMSSGFVVKGSDTAKFLQEKLAYLGLIPREYNEFIVYWLPLMQNNEYNLITFQTTAYEESALLHITPKPDSILRVFMAYMPLQEPLIIPEQKLESFERTGFSVIEWGGTCVE